MAEGLRKRLAHVGYRPLGIDTAIPTGAMVGIAGFPTGAAARAEVAALVDGRLTDAEFKAVQQHPVMGRPS